MRKRTQEERILDMIKRPVPRKRVGIVHLEMVRERRTLYGMKRFQNPREAAEMVRPLCEKADREMVLVLSLNGRLEPQAVEIAAVGGISSCNVDIRSLFKHALLNNASITILPGIRAQAGRMRRSLGGSGAPGRFWGSSWWTTSSSGKGMRITVSGIMDGCAGTAGSPQHKQSYEEE